MVAPDHHRKGARLQDRAHARLDVGVAPFGVGMDDVGVADIDDTDGGTEVGAVVLVVIGAGMAEGKERGCLAHRAGTEPGTGAELGAEVERSPEDRGVGLDLRPVLDIGPLAEGRDADERQVEAPAFVSVSCHAGPP